MAVGRVLEDSVLQEIAKAHGRSAAQFVLRRLLQQGVIALSRTVSPENVVGNIQVFDFVLASTEWPQFKRTRRDCHRIGTLLRRQRD